VTALHVNQDTDLVDVTVSGPNGTSVLHTTQHHPFWNETRHEWTDAAALRPGDRLHAIDGTAQTVSAVTVFVGSRQMRDLTVSDLHTYYVVAGDTPILVHNCGGVTIALGKAAYGLAAKADDAGIWHLMALRTPQKLCGSSTMPSTKPVPARILRSGSTWTVSRLIGSALGPAPHWSSG
jgi:hypothetical protein